MNKGFVDLTTVMSSESNSIKIGLMDNASHSLKRGYEMWTLWRDEDDPWNLKESVIWVHHGIELSLKQLLVQNNEFLVFQNVDRAIQSLNNLRRKPGMENAGVFELFDNDSTVMSVGFRKLIKRVSDTLSITELSKGQNLRDKIDLLTQIRNKIVHFSLQLDVMEVSSLLFDVLDPLLSLLGETLEDKSFREEVIPEIRRMAQPLQDYLIYLRAKIAQDAVDSTVIAHSEKGNGFAGIVFQVAGTGSSMTFAEYLKGIRLTESLREAPVVVIVDRIDRLYQLESLLKEEGLNVVVWRSEKDFYNGLEALTSSTVLTTVQKLSQTRLTDKKAVFVVYDVHRSTKKFISHLGNSTRILFTSYVSEEMKSLYGGIISQYDFDSALKDKVFKKVNVSKIELPNSNYEVKKLLSLRVFEEFEDAMIDFDIMESIAEEIVRDLEVIFRNAPKKTIVIVGKITQCRRLFESILRKTTDLFDEEEIRRKIGFFSSETSRERQNQILYSFNCPNEEPSLLICNSQKLLGYDNSLIQSAYVTTPLTEQLRRKVAMILSRSTLKEKSQLGSIFDFCDQDWSFLNER